MHASAKPIEEFLRRVRREHPELAMEDAFVAPRWFAQQKTWLEEPSQSDSIVYNYPVRLHLRGRLIVAALQQSLDEIVRRHQVLRSVFRIKEGELVQIVVAPREQRLRFVDLTDLPADTRKTKADQLAFAEANQPFDLARGPLLRSLLIRSGPEDHILQITSHQLVYDDWSVGILFRELSNLYSAFARGTKSLATELTYQYKDFVGWQGNELTGESFTAKVLFWKRQLTPVLGFQHLTPDFAPASKPAKLCARESMVLPFEAANSLKALSRQERASLFMVLLAGFKCLLHRYSNDGEIGVGSCMANRPLTETEGLIGRFANIVFLLTNLSGDPTFRELIARVRETNLTAYSEQNIPSGELKDPPAFQVMFILQNALEKGPKFPELRVEWTTVFTGTAAYDLNVWLKAEANLEVNLDYRTDLFHETTIKRLLQDYRRTMETMLLDPTARISSLAVQEKDAPAIGFTSNGAKNLVGSPDSSAPKNDAQTRLIRLWESAFNIHPIGIDEDFFQLGGDSLLGARLFKQMEETFQVELPVASLLEASTIRRLAEVISGRRIRSTNSVVVVQPDGTKPPFFCVYGHGGGIFYFGILARCLGPDQPLYGLRLEGLLERQANITVEDAAAYYLRELKDIQPQGPYVLSGYCFGGLVAYELARLLKAQGEEVALLILFNTPAPGSLRGWPYSTLVKRFTYELRKLRALQFREQFAAFSKKAAGLRRMILQGFGRLLWRALPPTSGADSNATAAGFLSLGNLSIVAAKAYAPPPYPGKITLFLTDEVGSRYGIHPEAGWRELARDGIEVRTVAGDNNSFFAPGNIEVLAEKVRICLSGAHGEPDKMQSVLSTPPVRDCPTGGESDQRSRAP